MYVWRSSSSRWFRDFASATRSTKLAVRKTDSNKRSVLQRPTSCSYLYFSYATYPLAHPLTPSFALSSAFANLPYPILSWLSLRRNNCSRTMHLLEALHVRQQHDANRNKNVAKREGEKQKRKKIPRARLRQTFARFLIQEFFSKAFSRRNARQRNCLDWYSVCFLYF